MRPGSCLRVRTKVPIGCAVTQRRQDQEDETEWQQIDEDDGHCCLRLERDSNLSHGT